MSKLSLPHIFQYKREYLKRDLIAAAVVTAISIPQSLAFAVVVGLPPITGLYTALLAPIVFALLASTRRLVIGADSATAALLASSASLVAQSGTAGYATAIGVLGLLTALILVIVAALRLGFVADLVSRPVLVGFLAGVGVQLIITSVPALLGISLTDHTIWGSITGMLGGVSINWMTVTISILVIGIMVVCRRTVVPGELLGLVVAGAFALLFHVEDFGVALVGSLAGGLPVFSIPSMNLAMVWTLLPAAATVAAVILAQSAATIRANAEERDEKVDMNQDLFALGMANAASAVTQGFAVNGSPPRTMILERLGGKSQMANVFGSLFVGAIILLGTGFLSSLPQAALAAIICWLGVYLIKLPEIQHLWRVHRTEFAVAMVALVGTAFLGVLQGVLIAVIVSLAERVIRQYHPKDVVLLRDGELNDWVKERLSGTIMQSSQLDGVLIYYFDGSLFFENITHFIARVHYVIDGAKQPVKVLIIDAGAIDSVDYTAVEAIKRLHYRLLNAAIELRFAHVSPNLHKQFTAYGVTGQLGHGHIYSTLTAAITADASAPDKKVLSKRKPTTKSTTKAAKSK